MRLKRLNQMIKVLNNLFVILVVKQLNSLKKYLQKLWKNLLKQPNKLLSYQLRI